MSGAVPQFVRPRSGRRKDSWKFRDSVAKAPTRIACRARPERMVRNPSNGEQMKKPADRVAKVTIAKQLKMLEALGPAKAIEAIGRSIENGWSGLFDPGGTGHTSGGLKPQRDLTKILGTEYDPNR